MRRALFALLLLLAAPAWAEDQPKDLSWQEMIPADAPPTIAVRPAMPRSMRGVSRGHPSPSTSVRVTPSPSRNRRS